MLLNPTNQPIQITTCTGSKIRGVIITLRFPFALTSLLRIYWFYLRQRRKDFLRKECPGYDNDLHLMLSSKNPENLEYFFIATIPRSTLDAMYGERSENFSVSTRKKSHGCTFSLWQHYHCRHVYHNVSAVVRSGLLQVVGMSNFTLYFAYRYRLF